MSTLPFSSCALRGLNNQQIRDFNCRLVMALLYKNKGMTKSQLACATQLSIPAISKIVNALITQRRVENSPLPVMQKGNSKGLYKVSSNRPFTVCMSVSPTRIQAIMVDNEMTPTSTFIDRWITPQNPAELIENMVAVIVACRHSKPNANYRLSIAVHGQVDVHVGSSMHMPQAPWSQPIELKYLLEQRLNVEVIVDNDCVMLALAEKWLNGRYGEDFCVLNIDYGIGSSFLINNNIYRGKRFGSGQIGHIKVASNGIICGCGREGCLETQASSTALCNQYLSRITNAYRDSRPFTFNDFVKRYKENDPIAIDLADQAANLIGQSLYNFLITLNINKIILYGNICDLGEPWLGAIVQQMVVNPFEDQSARKQDQTLVSFGNLTQIERIVGMSYLWAERELDTLFV